MGRLLAMSDMDPLQINPCKCCVTCRSTLPVLVFDDDAKDNLYIKRMAKQGSKEARAVVKRRMELKGLWNTACDTYSDSNGEISPGHTMPAATQQQPLHASNDIEVDDGGQEGGSEEAADIDTDPADLTDTAAAATDTDTGPATTDTAAAAVGANKAAGSAADIAAAAAELKQKSARQMQLLTEVVEYVRQGKQNYKSEQGVCCRL